MESNLWFFGDESGWSGMLTNLILGCGVKILLSRIRNRLSPATSLRGGSRKILARMIQTNV